MAFYKKLFQPVVDLFFPPICVFCLAESRTKLLCENCWTFSSPIDPLKRCLHCFQEVESARVCFCCREKKALRATRGWVFEPESPIRTLGDEYEEALAGFLVWQWIQLEWPYPDNIIPMPGALDLGRAFAFFLQRPFIRAFGKGRRFYEESLEENQRIFLIDFQSEKEKIEWHAKKLEEAFPKRIFVLSLFGDVDSNY